MQKQQVSFIDRVIRFITSGLYLVVASVLISLFPIKKLKLITPLKPLNIKHSKRNYCVSTQEIIRRVRTISNNCLGSTIWLDRDEYEKELIDICHLENFDNSYFPDYYDFSYECQTKAYSDCDNEQSRLIAKDQYNQLVFDYEEKRKFLEKDLQELKLKAVNRSYSCLCYWPYDHKKESLFTDEEMQKAKFCLQQQINANKTTSKNYL
jgi:hypothetical protein